MNMAWGRLGGSPWLFAGPAVAAAILFVWLPMAATLGLSFFDWSLLRQEATWRGLDHYRGTLANPDFHLALVNTGVYLLALLPLQVGVPLVLAFALMRVQAKATGRVYRTALFAPSVLSFPVAAVVWLWLFNPTVGFLNTLTRHGRRAAAALAQRPRPRDLERHRRRLLEELRAQPADLPGRPGQRAERPCRGGAHRRGERAGVAPSTSSCP